MAVGTYLGRYIRCNRPTSADYTRLPQRALRPSPAPIVLDPAIRPGLDQLRLSIDSGAPPRPLVQLLDQTATTAFVVLVDGRLSWHHYAWGGTAHPWRCFSVTKSIASALVGLAVASGAIDSLDAPISRWLPDLRDARAGQLTLLDLLEMRSGIRFVEGLWPWRDEPRTYYADDLRRRVLSCRMTDPPRAFFHYNDWHPLLISLVLERATGMSVTAWLQSRLWDPLGAQDAASIMVDRRDDDGLEHLESGLTATARDLAKFGQLYLQDGVWQGRRLLPAGWAESTTAPEGARTDAEWYRYYRDRPWGRVFARGRTYYKCFWWGHRIDANRHDFFAMGVLGQHIYVSPDTRVVIVRLSNRFPPGMWWAPILRQVAEAASAH